MSAAPSVTLRQLRGLLALSETRNFHRAAERLGITQPSLSSQIQALEGALGLTLVERSRAGAALTPLGREVAARARVIVDGATALEDFAAGAQSGLRGAIRLGVSPTLGPYLLPAAVAALHRAHPDLKLHIREAPPRTLSRDLSEGAHDLILTQLPVREEDLHAEALFQEPLLLVLAADHPLAASPRVRPQDLEGLDILTLDQDYTLHDQVAQLCETFGAKVARNYEGTSLDALRLMAGMGMGAAFVPALYARSEIREGSEVVARQLAGRSVGRSIGLVWRRTAASVGAFRTIADVLRETAERLRAEG